MSETKNFVRKNVTITKEDEEWIKEKHLNFSSWIRDKIEEDRSQKGGSEK